MTLGRREVKWDAAPADMRGDFFNTTDADGRSLGQYHAPVRTDATGFSFVGVVFDTPLVGEVRITSGQHAVGADVQDLSHGGNRDLVVMDDFLCGEPQAMP